MGMRNGDRGTTVDSVKRSGGMEMQMVLQRVIMYDVYDGRRKALGTRAEA